jgi:hypothetical protein
VLLIIASDTGSVLMHSHDGRIDHLHSRIMHCSQCIHDHGASTGRLSTHRSLNVPRFK